MDNNRHSVLIRFLGAAGEVTPSSTLIQAKDHSSGTVARILTDAGSAIREETRDSKDLKTIGVIEEEIDAILLTHVHTDHVGGVPDVVQKHPNAPVFAPLGNKHIMKVIIEEAHKRQREREPLAEIETWRKKMIALICRMETIEKELSRGVPKGRKGRTTPTQTHEAKATIRQDLTVDLETIESQIWYGLGLTAHSTSELFELLERDITGVKRHDTIGIHDFKEAVSKVCENRLHELTKQGIVTIQDVNEATSKIQELSLGKSHTIAQILGKKQAKKDITATLRNSGHTHIVPATQVLLEIPVKGGSHINILFSGDRGNSQLKPPYAQADDTGLEDSADALILESTYGDRIHADREKELEKLDTIVIEAIKNGEDIIFPIISFDRPLMVMYEIVIRLVKTKKIKPEDVDIYYFGQMISKTLPSAHINEMMKEIKKYWKNWNELEQDDLPKFAKRGKKSRIVFAGGGFLPKKGSPAGALLEFALTQHELEIIFANYHGDEGSNAQNLLDGKEFLLTKENIHPQKLTAGQKGHYTAGFSGHEDGPGLVVYARKVVRRGGTIFLNHGTEKSRQALAWLLMRDPIIQEKNITVVLPRSEKDYIIKQAKRKNKGKK